MFNKRLTAQVQTATFDLSLSMLTSLAIGVVTVAQAYYLSQTIALAFLQRYTLATIKPYLFWLLGLSLLRALLVWSAQITAQRTAGHVKSTLRERLTAHLLALGPAFSHGERSGELVNTASEGIEALDAYFSQYLPQLATAALVPLTILIFVFPNDVLSGVVLLVTAPIIPVFMVLIGSIAEEMTKKQWVSLSRMSAHFLDVLQGLTTLKLLGRSREQQQTIAEMSNRFRETTMNVLRVAFLSALVLEMAATISTAVIAVEVGLRLLYAKMVFAQALFVLVLAPEFYVPLRLLGTRFHAGMTGVAAAKRIFQVLDTPLPIAITATTATKLPSPAHMQIQFNHVYYAYEDGQRPALNGVAFSIAAAQTTALVGPSGAGKSTVAHLLLRFIDPQRGDISVGGVPLSALDVADWRAQIAWVPQTPYLFDDTIAENIRLAYPGAKLAQVEAAAHQAHAAAFIESLPQGYHTRIGERGARLSGGEAQRIALARAFLKNAPLLLFDEATANLDPQHEADIQQVISNLMQGRTVLLIAHRLNTVYQADKILVLANGKIVEQGTHTSLLRQQGVYHNLVATYVEATQ